MTIGEWMTRSGVGFGTSGARGLVASMTDAVCFAYVLGYLQHLQTLGEFAAGGSVALAGDLRPSTPRILRACTAAVTHAGGEPVFCGYVPTPALCLHAYGHAMPSMMVTGSHIPDDRNGIKFNRARGEFLKEDEPGMRAQHVALPVGWFDDAGALLQPVALPDPLDVISPYIARYRNFFGADSLAGLRLGVYQHSAVGRDCLVSVLEALGATVTPLARSATFLPVDTEAVREQDIALAREWGNSGQFDAILTTDGDSDRPLIADSRGHWLRGDVLGILAARHLGARAVTTPVNSNTALEKAGFAEHIDRTRIGSPYVVAGMTRAAESGLVPSVGYEANGGFLLATPVDLHGRHLGALPTRDAMLPMICALAAARAGGCDLATLIAALPGRFTLSDRLTPLSGQRSAREITALRNAVARDPVLPPFAALCGAVTGIDETDGLRLFFANGDILHFRPSGNAPELRVYVESDRSEQARHLLAAGLAFVAPWRD